jgi:hypothetical protein
MPQKRVELIAARGSQAVMRALIVRGGISGPAAGGCAYAEAADCHVFLFGMFVRRRVPWHRADDRARILEGLRKPGWEG